MAVWVSAMAVWVPWMWEGGALSPLRGRTRYCTRAASFSLPVMMSARPRRAVERESVTSTVASKCSGGSCAISSAIAQAILERKIRPASCTWPMANGSEL
eukprot:4533866-Prymnesium_polylepis.2